MIDIGLIEDFDELSWIDVALLGHDCYTGRLPLFQTKEKTCKTIDGKLKWFAGW
jgi:hypothetical protein